jgi:predicted AAA+ superfamily ATPase
LIEEYKVVFAMCGSRVRKVRPNHANLMFSDVGLVNCLAQRGAIAPKSELLGKAFENWVHHELCAWIEYHKRSEQLTYLRLSTGLEVNFILGHMACAIEAKASQKIHNDHLKGLRELRDDYPEVQQRIVVSLEVISRRTNNGIEILTVADVIRQLWDDEFLNSK